MPTLHKNGSIPRKRPLTGLRPTVKHVRTPEEAIG
jgi:hypothetical protein